MSDEQTTASSTQPWPTGEPDDSEPSPERQAELRAAYDKNMAAGRPPYAGVELHTRGELQWMVRERGWSSDGYRRAEFIDLREVDISEANLSGASLSGANLSRAIVAKTNLSEATLDLAILSGVLVTDATLSGAKLRGAKLNEAKVVASNLSGAELTLANLSGVIVSRTTLTRADLSGANLSRGIVNDSTLGGAMLGLANLSGALVGKTNLRGASLGGANLSGATIACDLPGVSLRAARMDATTLLGTAHVPVTVDSQTRLLDVAWNGAILSSVRWEEVPQLVGDEAAIKAATTRNERVQALRDAARAYRGLAKALQAQGLTTPALKYRTREQQLERKALFWSIKPGQWLFSWLLNIVSGYGDRPGRGVLVYLGAIVWFANVYHWLGLPSLDSVVFSLASFHGRGFFPAETLTLHSPMVVLAAMEAVIGLFIELVFIATFTQRFFAR